MPVPRDEMSDALRARLQEETAANIARLQGEGRLLREKAAIDQTFQWPVKLTDGHPGRNAYVIGNYVDENPAFPNLVKDYSCGARTYDLPSGYNHSGTDFMTWPFPWRRMAQGEAVVIAAAPGTIVNKQDGNFDQNCTFSYNSPNLVFVRHGDGSVAWYLHLKSGSATAKAVGDPVAAGEFLGIVGSSGSSTAPHLHFELFDSTSQQVDPWAGTCNTRGNLSRWELQEPYYVPRINHLATADAPPEFPACPGIEDPHEQRYFVPGQDVYAVGYFRDLKKGDLLVYNLYRPDGSRFFSAPIDTGGTATGQVYSSSYFYQTVTLPANAPPGEWTFEIVYLGTTERTSFFVGGREPPRISAVEYYAASLDHYFFTAFPEEQAALDRGAPVAGWVRTGVTFPAYADAGPRGIPPACRFFGTPGLGVNSHFYTVFPFECSVVKQNPGWTFEANAFNLASPSAGACPDGTRPLYRMYNNGMRESPNHRYVTDLAVASGMTAAGWLLEGAAMCLPQ